MKKVWYCIKQALGVTHHGRVDRWSSEVHEGSWWHSLSQNWGSSTAPLSAALVLSSTPNSQCDPWIIFTNATGVNKNGALVFSQALLGETLNSGANLSPPSSSSSLLLQPSADIFVPLSCGKRGGCGPSLQVGRRGTGNEAQLSPPVCFRLSHTAPTAHSIIT